MPDNQKSVPVSAIELKAVIYRKIGCPRAKDYFDLLQKFLSLKLKKSEFDKLCKQIIGRDNLSLHNLLIRTILKNSFAGKVPLLRAKNNVEVANGVPVNSRSLVNQDRKFRDGPSPLGQLWKSKIEQISLGSRHPTDFASVEDGEVVEQADGSPGIDSKSHVTTSLEISTYNSAGKSLSSGTGQTIYPLTCHQTCELPDTRSLMILLEKKLEMEGLEISVDCVNVLNNGLDCYLKRLIKTCVGLESSRLVTERPQHIVGQRKTAFN